MTSCPSAVRVVSPRSRCANSCCAVAETLPRRVQVHEHRAVVARDGGVAQHPHVRLQRGGRARRVRHAKAQRGLAPGGQRCASRSHVIVDPSSSRAAVPASPPPTRHESSASSRGNGGRPRGGGDRHLLHEGLRKAALVHHVRVHAVRPRGELRRQRSLEAGGVRADRVHVRKRVHPRLAHQEHVHQLAVVRHQRRIAAPRGVRDGQRQHPLPVHRAATDASVSGGAYRLPA